jgi:ornithine cyclodeaminase/alanine dehydrogenase-like protein (mu-crystallin family)
MVLDRKSRKSQIFVDGDVKRKPADLVLLSGREIEALVTPEHAIAAVEDAYRQLAGNRDDQGRSLGFAVEHGSIHVKAGLLPGSHLCFAAKINVNLPDNRQRSGLPTIQGVVVLADAVTGRPLALLEAMSLTALRTAATAALAARYGARRDARRAAIIGCGAQARFQLAAIASSFALQEVLVFDADAARAEVFARSQAGAAYRCTARAGIAEAVDGADICITCTTATAPVLTDDLALAGCFVAAVGADNPDKQEIDPALMRRARLLVDDIDACASGGDLHHALKAGLMSRDGVHADLADLASGRKQGRQSPGELVIFDSTGSGVQDVAVAWTAFQRARERGGLSTFDLAG